MPMPSYTAITSTHIIIYIYIYVIIYLSIYIYVIIYLSIYIYYINRYGYMEYPWIFPRSSHGSLQSPSHQARLFFSCSAVCRCMSFLFGGPAPRVWDAGKITKKRREKGWGSQLSLPRCSMYGIFTYIWVIFRVNVGKYSIHGAYGYENGWWLGVPLFQETSICVSELPGTTWSYHFTHEHRQKTAVLILHLTFETISHLIDSLQIVEFPYLI